MYVCMYLETFIKLNQKLYKLGAWKLLKNIQGSKSSKPFLQKGFCKQVCKFLFQLPWQKKSYGCWVLVLKYLELNFMVNLRKKQNLLSWMETSESQEKENNWLRLHRTRDYYIAVQENTMKVHCNSKIFGCNTVTSPPVSPDIMKEDGLRSQASRSRTLCERPFYSSF